MKSLFWKRTEVQITTDKPGAELRFEVGSTLTYLEDQKKAIAFGGLRADSAVEAGKEVKEEPKKPSFSFKGGFSLGEKQAAVLENLQALDVANSKWTISNCTGKHPSVRVHHYALYEQPYLIVYSGLEKKLLNDMYALNTRTGIWKKMFSLESPPPRLFGGFVQLKDRKYLIGGCKHPENGTDLYSDAWSLSFANVNWEVSGGDVPGSVWAHVEYNNVGGAFLPLKHFSINAISEETAFLFGGFTTNNEPSNREFVFNARAKEMKLVDIKGAKPSARGRHKMVTVNSNLLLLFGGYSQFDADLTKFDKEVFLYHTDISTWERPIVGGGLPAELSYFGLSLKHSDSKSTEIVLLGCKTGTNQPQQYELLSNMQQEFAPQPPARTAAKQVVPQKKVLKETNQRGNIQEELEEGYKMTEQQRLKMAQLEETLAAMKRENEELKARLERSRELNREETEQVQPTTQLTSKVMSLLLMEHKKRRFLELKSSILQNTIRDAEKLTVTMDAYSDEDRKAQHIAHMKQFRRELEDIWSKEKALKKEINSRKSGLDLNKLLMESLSEEEAQLLSSL